jgi:Ca2+-binding EF-hand superfamily protein
MRQNQAAFQQLDRDRNGVLTAEEFAGLVNPQAIPADPAPLMQAFDGNGDGIITLVEYRVRTQANFDSVDVDRDGMVTNSEMQAAGIVAQ